MLDLTKTEVTSKLDTEIIQSLKEYAKQSACQKDEFLHADMQKHELLQWVSFYNDKQDTAELNNNQSEVKKCAQKVKALFDVIRMI